MPELTPSVGRVASRGLVSSTFFSGETPRGVALPSIVLLELLHVSVSSAAVLCDTPRASIRLLLWCKTSLSVQCHTVNIKSTPSRTILYVCRNLLLKSIASTSFLNRGSFPGSSGSARLPPAVLVKSSSSADHGVFVEAVAVIAKRRTCRSHGASAMTVEGDVERHVCAPTC